MRRVLGAMVVLAAVVAVSGRVDAAPEAGGGVRYLVTDLGTLGGIASGASDVNEHGEVSGVANTLGTRTLHGFFWSGGVMTDIGALQDDVSTATALNDSSVVVGTGGVIHEPGGPVFEHGIRWTPAAGLMDLAQRIGEPSTANDVNDRGQIVGRTVFGNESHAYVLSGRRVRDLGALGPEGSEALAVDSAARVVVGESDVPGTFEPHAFRWSGGQMVDLGTLGGLGSSATDVNDSGVIVGFADTDQPSGNDHAFRWDGTMHDLGTLSTPNAHSEAFGINEAGVIVGETDVTGFAEPHAFRWTESSGMVDLNTLIPAGAAWQLTVAMAVSDAGQIVGHGHHFPFEEDHAFLLTPYTPTSGPALSTGPVAHLDLGPVPVGEEGTFPLAVTNTGSQTVRISSVTVTGPDADEFSVAEPGARRNIPPGSSLDIPVTVVPDELGTRSASLVIDSNDPDSPDVVALTATGAGSADLAAQVTVTPDPAARGTTVTVDASVVNLGPGPADGPFVFSSLPSGLTLRSLTADPPSSNCHGPAHGSSGSIQCQVDGTLQPGAAQHVIVTARVTAPAGSTLAIPADVFHVDPTPDPNAGNDHTSTTLHVT